MPKNEVDKLLGWLENLGGTPLEDLREISRSLGHNVEREERDFMCFLSEQSQKHNLRLAVDTINSSQTASAWEIEDKAPIKSLLGRAAKYGIKNVSQFAEAVGLGSLTATKAENKLLDAASVPLEIVSEIARVLKTSFENVAEYLNGEQRMAADSRLGSKEAPKMPPKQDFFEAVRNDKSLSEDRRQKLLAMKRP